MIQMNESIFGSEGPKFTYNLGVADIEFTVNATTNICSTSSAHGLFNKEIIMLSSTDTLPDPLETTTYYYVLYLSTTTFKISETPNGAEIDITDIGTGTHSLKSEYTVSLNNWVDMQSEPDGDTTLTIESQLQVDRDFIDRGGDFLIYSGRVLLFNYDNVTLARSKFEEIYMFNKKKVYLYKHRDGSVYKDYDGNNVQFYMTVIAKNFDTLDYRDLLFVTFRSLKAVNLSNDSAILIQPDEIFMGGGMII